MRMKFVLMVLISLVVLTAVSALIDQPDRPAMSNCSNIAAIGLSKGGIYLDNQKVLAFFNADDSQLSYYCTKNIIGLWGEDYYLEITYLNGTYVVLNDTMLVYGVYPGKTTSASILKQVARDGLGSMVWSSPNYASVSSLNSIKTYIQNQRDNAAKAKGGGGPAPLSEPGTTYTLSYDYAIDVVSKITPDVSKYKNVRTFSRLVMLNIDGTPTLVKLTLGVWLPS